MEKKDTCNQVLLLVNVKVDSNFIHCSNKIAQSSILELITRLRQNWVPFPVLQNSFCLKYFL